MEKLEKEILKGISNSLLLSTYNPNTDYSFSEFDREDCKAYALHVKTVIETNIVSINSMLKAESEDKKNQPFTL